MKVYISKYRNHWLSPYTILERVLFWKDWENISYSEPWVDRWAKRLEPACLALQWVRERIHPRYVYVKIDPWDTWSMDYTLALIVLPMLKQLQATKHGSPNVADDDVPDDLKRTAVPEVVEWETDSNWELRWDWVLSEMIFAFEHLVDDSWEDQFWSGDYDPSKQVGDSGWEGTRVWDKEGQMKVEERISNGLVLFGKYFRNLWD